MRLTGKPYFEYRDGEVTQKSMPTKFHSLVQLALQLLLMRQGVRAMQELTVRVSASRFLVPDVCVGEDFEGPYPTEPRLLCCEVLSPDDRLGAMLSKCEEYHTWGVPYCWVVDPVKRSAWEYHAGGEPKRVADELVAGDLKVKLVELFAELGSA